MEINSFTDTVYITFSTFSLTSNSISVINPSVRVKSEAGINNEGKAGQ